MRHPTKRKSGCEIFSQNKGHIFWEGHKILRNLHQLFDCQYIGQIIGGDFLKFCGLLRVYELYSTKKTKFPNWFENILKMFGVAVLQNLHQLFVLCTASQIIGGDFSKFCGLIRIHEL